MHRYGKGLNDLIERRSTFLTYLYNTYVGVYIRTSAIIVYWNWVLVTRGVRYRWVLRPKCGTTIPNFVIVVNNGWIIVMMRTGLYWLSRWLIVGGLVFGEPSPPPYSKSPEPLNESKDCDSTTSDRSCWDFLARVSTRSGRFCCLLLLRLRRLNRLKKLSRLTGALRGNDHSLGSYGGVWDGMHPVNITVPLYHELPIFEVLRVLREVWGS